MKKRKILAFILVFIVSICNCSIEKVPIAATEGVPEILIDTDEVLIGQFKEIPLGSVDSDCIVSFTSSDESIIKVGQKGRWSGNTTFRYEPQSEGSATITAEFEKGADIYTDTVEVTVKEAAKNVVPLKSYTIYYNLEKSGRQKVDENQDDMIDEEEIKNAQLLYCSNQQLINEELECLERAVNLERIDFSKNPNLTDVSILKELPNLHSVYLTNTGVSEKDRLDIIKNEAVHIYETGCYSKDIYPYGIIDLGCDSPDDRRVNVTLSIEDPSVASVDMAPYKNTISNKNCYIEGKKVGKTNLIISGKEASIKIPIVVEEKPEDLVEMQDKKLLLACDANMDGYVSQNELKTVERATMKYDSDDVIDLSPLEKAPKLRCLELNRVTDEVVEQISKLTNLKILHLNGTFTNVDALEKCKNIISLVLISDQLTDISGISNMKRMGKLQVTSSSVEDYSSIKNMKYLRVMHFSDMNDSIIQAVKNIDFSWISVPDHATAEQILELADLKDKSVVLGSNINSSLSPKARGLYFNDENPFEVSVENTDMVTNNKFTVKGEVDVNVKVKGTNVSKTIHITVKNSDDIESIGNKVDELPVLSQNYEESSLPKFAITKEDGNVYSGYSGKKITDSAETYAADFVYDDGFILRHKVGKNGRDYLGTEDISLTIQDKEIDTILKNYVLTKDHDLYKFDVEGNLTKIDENVKQILLSQTRALFVLYMNGNLVRKSNGEIIISNVSKVLSTEYVVLNDGTTWYCDMNFKISYKVLDVEANNKVKWDGYTPILFAGNSLYYIRNDHSAEEIAKNVKYIFPECQHIYESLDGNLYRIQSKYNRTTKKIEWTSVAINPTDKKFTGLASDGTYYVKGEKLITDIASCTRLMDVNLGYADYAFVRTDGTVWSYVYNEFPEKVSYADEDLSIKMISQPVNYEGTIGEIANFTVEAEGEGLKYQWQYSNDGGVNWKNSSQSGNKTATVEVPITEVRDCQQYRCVVTDAKGSSVTSEAAILKVLKALAIISQPVDYRGEAGETACFNIKAEGEGLEYQWQFSNDDGINWRNSSQSGNKTATVEVPITEVRDRQQYRCVVTDAKGSSVTSEAAILKVLKTLTIISQPINYRGEVNDTANFTVEAEGEGLKYQWQYSNNGGSIWKNSSQSGNKTKTIHVPITEARDGQQYRCVITDETGNSVTSEAAKIIVGVAIEITSQPVDYTGTVGETATFTVQATGEGLKYQWQFSNDDGENWRNSSQSGNKTENVSVPITAARNGQQYRCVVTDGNSNSVISEAGTLIVK
ncbi:hypothetical protein BHF69_08500 [Anaerostipes sp. 992a]|uniref:immunoglobulin domain-containing protein n=1 Tax=Anaerostipes sp. 992a TaxID=1261637 RepID=UPI000952AE7E|nr:immunoglobulin domain-containing protein [Anaerostipes sp. 992a]OLR62712.1 hypothetical protein BHF69_08500 [Anaerostipes sp. 992a]